jgi:hypothetical protein
MRGFRFLPRRFFTTEGTVEKVITKNTTKEGATIFERIRFVERFNKLSKFQRRSLATYGLLATGSFTFAIYNDGRSELIEHWNKARSPQSTIRSGRSLHSSDWEAAKRGCKNHVWMRFCESILFPYTCVSSVMPYVVLGTTKKE